ncbi:hypothetical protein BSLG_003178 [Batrachochytrium salamandrivorans]|nr:hypothetical protein BSLG_003178 [Batrachochytrium salamandrivorans]
MQLNSQLLASYTECQGTNGIYQNKDEVDVLKDLAKLRSAKDLIQYWGYPCEEHVAITADGYMLGLQRIPNRRRDSVCHTTSMPCNRASVILWHGLAISSDVFVCNVTPKLNLALVLADAGYDVWLGNTRGNRYSRGHQTLDLSKRSDSLTYWDFSIDELASFDITAAVDYVLSVTGHQQVSYIGFSQGAAQAFAALAVNNELNGKIRIFVALAPALKPQPIQSKAVMGIVRTLGPSFLFNILGNKAFLPIANHFHALLPSSVYAFIVQTALQSLFGWKCDRFGPYTRRVALYSRIFSDTSVKLVAVSAAITNVNA